mmetsp:Transcript_687/g.1384  ORF Transcript_687/g.1384 Transcript_687/m.1384 type:complete len:82 (+) Transcript_687:484-729(+)|eukprot:CAMPEP_0173267830 /NCGR_PEP_ID=MMETSP1142-20121109/29992_1 /TAXON_ID=483371 /ORGANISM="non described non described, Strain CCMP2298" /LENGTH=81 /DNA_ID=CAMNT_0014204011 /DNA_START=438 /DNA_END=683 /DNA_ORIENTATION=+
MADHWEPELYTPHLTCWLEQALTRSWYHNLLEEVLLSQYCDPSMSSHTRPDHWLLQWDLRYDTSVDSCDEALLEQVGQGNM